MNTVDEGSKLSRDADRLVETFFSLNSWSQLEDFASVLDLNDPFQAALKYYVVTWRHQVDPHAVFDPEVFVSRDLSAIYLGDSPVVFEGTNCWAEKCYLSREDHLEKMETLYARCQRFRLQNPNGQICLMLIPEKDFVINQLFLGGNRYDVILGVVQELQSRLAQLEISLVFEEPLVGLSSYMTPKDFYFPDSHLPPRVYVQYFAQAIKKLGLSWDLVSPSIAMEQMKVYYDLSTKFKGGRDHSFDSFELLVKDSEVSQTSGSAYFESPLGQTSQFFMNGRNIFDHNVKLLGDSHSSIYSQRRLTYLFANTFKKSEFHWNPSGVRHETELNDGDIVVLEISSRFVF